MSNAEEHQRQAARIVLAAIAPVGFALAGSGAIREHGLIHRPTHDIDLFTPAVPRPPSEVRWSKLPPC